MENITCLVTGANSGLGFAMASGLAKTGATVVMLCRDAQRGKKARIKVIEQSQNPNVDLMICDLSSLSEVRRFTSEFKMRYPDLHVLANLAGANYSWRKETKEGIERNFTTNVLGPFLMTNLLSELIVHSAPASIINVSGEHHRTGSINFEDPGLKWSFTPSRSKKQACLARVIWTFELARRLQGTRVTVNTFAPGWTNTGIYRHLPFFLRWPCQLAARFYAKKPGDSVKPAIDLVLDPAYANTSRQYFIEGKPGKPVPLTNHLPVADRLWALCERMTGYKMPFPARRDDVWAMEY